MEAFVEALGQVVRHRREGLGLTQDELGRRAGYGKGAGVSISRIENGLTRPVSERLNGIALALQTTPEQLEEEVSAVCADPTRRTTGPHATNAESIKKRIQEEIERRTGLIAELGTDFNHAHDRARDQFFMRFLEVANRIDGVMKPDPASLHDDDVSNADPEAEAAFRLNVATYGITNVLAGGAGGAVAGAAVGGAAAYSTFIAAVSFGTASTGAAISGLSGAAATNAALALLGGGTLAAGGAGVAGGTLLLTGIVAAPALLLAVGGVVWMRKRNRRQQHELLVRLTEAEAEMVASQRSFDALVEILPQATELLDYVAVHAAHALERWSAELGPGPREWGDMATTDRQLYDGFIRISASQLAVVSINVQELMSARDDHAERLIDLAEQVLSQSRTVVESLV